MSMYYFGWIDDPKEVQTFIATLERPYFSDYEAYQASYPATTSEQVFLWEACRKVLGRLLPPRNQGSVGSCVSFGWGSCIEHLQCVEIAQGDPEEYKDVAQEVIYGGSRVEIGGGRIRGDGSVGAWAARWVTEYGVVPRGVYGSIDLTRYDERRTREYGYRGCPDELEPIAKKHPIKTVALTRSWEEAKRALRNGYPISICSNQGFEMTRDQDGFSRPRGSWAHCMALLGYQTGRREGGFILNSWGGEAHRGPIGAGDHSPGGFWAEADVVDRMLRQGDSFAMSSFQGFPARQLNWLI